MLVGFAPGVAVRCSKPQSMPQENVVSALLAEIRYGDLQLCISYVAELRSKEFAASLLRKAPSWEVKVIATMLLLFLQFQEQKFGRWGGIPGDEGLS